MKRAIPLLAAAIVAAVVLLHPLRRPNDAPAAWSSPTPRADLPHVARAQSPTPAHALAYVAGEVTHPGVYPIAPDARVREVIAVAGGARPSADLVAVNLAAHVRDGDEIVVPQRGASSPPTASGAGMRPRHGRGATNGTTHRKHRRYRHAAPDTPPSLPVDINSADAVTLATIPGIGDGLAERIIAYRKQNGPFASIDELLDVAGITEHRLDAMIPYVVAR